MNERINRLWWNARIGYNNQNCDPEVVEKFANLIIHECANYAFSDDQERTNMLKHFGVNE